MLRTTFCPNDSCLCCLREHLTAAGIDTNNNQLKAAMAMATGKATMTTISMAMAMVTAATMTMRTEAAVEALTTSAQTPIN